MTDDTGIAIVGIGGIFPGGPTLEDYWQLIVSGSDCARRPPAGRWTLDPDDVYAPDGPRSDSVYSQRACFIEEWPVDHPGLDLDPGDASALDPLFHLVLHATKSAFSGVRESPDRTRTGIVLGALALPTEKSSEITEALLGTAFAEGVWSQWASSGAGGRRAATSPILPLNREVTGGPAKAAAQALELAGTAFTLDAACASSLYALQLAADELRSGRADAMLAGGVSRPDSLYTQMGFSQLRALSPTGRCAPFDRDANGIVVGEGAGIFLLKRLGDAVRAGDEIFGVIRGIGLSNDLGGSLLAPSSEGQLRAMRAAYDAAGWRPDDVDLIECHATGTPVGDATEIASLRTLWEDCGGTRGACVVGSVKSNVGHLLTAAGAAGLMKVVLALRHRQLPPTANYEASPSNFALADTPFRVLRTGETWSTRTPETPRRAAVSAFGFGGINAHVLIEEWQPERQHAPRAEMRKTEPVRYANARETGPDGIAIVGMDACVGPWRSLHAFGRRVFGGDADRSPEAPRRWWGLERRPDLVGVPPRGYFLENFEVPLRRFRIPPRELEEMLPQQLIMLRTAANAIEDARWDLRERPRTGVFIGLELDLNTTNFHLRWSLLEKARTWARAFGLDLDRHEFDAWLADLREAAGPPLTANRTLGALASIAASRIAREFRFGGPCFTISSGNGSGWHAFETAVRALERREIDSAVVGAVDFPGEVRSYAARNAPGTFRVTEDGAGDRTPSPPWVGEGAAAITLKRLDDARRDADRIYAVIRDVGRTVPPAVSREASCDLDVDGADIEDTVDDVGDAGAVSGLACIIKAALCLHHQMLPPPRSRNGVASVRALSPAPAPWVRDRRDGPRRATIGDPAPAGTRLRVVLEEADSTSAPAPIEGIPAADEGLFVLEAADHGSLEREVEKLEAFTRAAVADSMPGLSERWRHEHPPAPEKSLAVAIVAGSIPDLRHLLGVIRDRLHGSERNLDAAVAERIFFSFDFAAGSERIAFLFPGSGNQIPGMARALALRWPEILRRHDRENSQLRSQMRPEVFWGESREVNDPHAVILGQVCVGTIVSDLVRTFGVDPHAVIGYSLGETTGLFALRAWRDRDVMLERMRRSPLFRSELAGPCHAARRTWGSSHADSIDWTTGVLDRPPQEVRRALRNHRRAYLLIVNAPDECVVGGATEEVARLVRETGGNLVPLTGVSTVHCEVVNAVARTYRDLHLLPTTPPAGVSFYSAAWGRTYSPTEESAADSIVAQALHGFDYSAVIEAAYRDGVRGFLEMGPGSSCTRLVGKILGDRPHFAASVGTGRDEIASLLRFLGQLAAVRIPVHLAPLRPTGTSFYEVKSAPPSLSIAVGGAPFRIPDSPRIPRSRAVLRTPTPPRAALPDEGGREPPPTPTTTFLGATPSDPLVDQFTKAQAIAVEAQEVFLRLSAAYRAVIAEQATSVDTAAGSAGARGASDDSALGRGIGPVSVAAAAFPRHQCLEFAVGSIARVLGAEFAEVDTHPTRVRLPAEPLMLVDRILTVDGVPKSLGEGRIVTEHDVKHDAWYLDGGRIPTAIAVEAGQADLFLSAYLGIDFQTRGLAVYRLLDAEVTFHAPLPRAGATIRYDIVIERFFRQGDTFLFRFRFDGTVDGEPLLTMRDGCAGFFSAVELRAGQGIVETPRDRKPRVGERSPDWRDLVPLKMERYSDEQIAALRDGDLAACLGAPFGDLALRHPRTLPGGRLRLVDRVVKLDPHGGRFRLGVIQAELDIHPDDWFLVCHFVDDPVMPGTLMYECCLHTLRILLLRFGWVGEAEEFSYEPLLGVPARLKCRGQVTAETRRVSYRVSIKEIGYDPAPYVVSDALMYADGKPIVEIQGMALRLTGLHPSQLERLWQASRGAQSHSAPPRRAIFDRDRILAFAVGKPSAAFGERYRVFDAERTIARLPGPPYQFLDRITGIDAEPWKLIAGGQIEAEYDIPGDGWYFTAERHPRMPFAVLLEVALQPCGWFAAYQGAALTSAEALAFRNLGGTGVQHRAVTPGTGTLTTTIRNTEVSQSGGMIIHHFEFSVQDRSGVVYEGTTYFGFFTRPALANQIGLRNPRRYVPAGDEQSRAQAFSYPTAPPYPDDRLRMIDAVPTYIPNGGPSSLGFVRGSKRVRPDEWFFAAHFFQDPVYPGSLGLESFLQLLKVAAGERWGAGEAILCESFSPGLEHRWTYRGQVLPTDHQVEVEASITDIDDARRTVRAAGFLSVDGRIIYHMEDFAVRWNDAHF